MFLFCVFYFLACSIYKLSMPGLFVLLFYFPNHYVFNISIHHHRNAKHTGLNRMRIQFKGKNQSLLRKIKQNTFDFICLLMCLFCFAFVLFVFSVLASLAEWLCVMRTVQLLVKDIFKQQIFCFVLRTNYSFSFLKRCHSWHRCMLFREWFVFDCCFYFYYQ